MPIQSCTLSGGGSGYKWGKHGHCYPSKEGAKKQMRAIFHSGYTGAEDKTDAEIEFILDVTEAKKKKAKDNSPDLSASEKDMQTLFGDLIKAEKLKKGEKDNVRQDVRKAVVNPEPRTNNLIGGGY